MPAATVRCMARSGGTRKLSGVGLLLAAPAERDPAVDVLAGALRAVDAGVAAGCTSVWVGEASAEPPARVAYEAYSLLGALAARTEGVHLGVVSDGAPRRAPSMLAKIVTAVDVLSHGRAVLSLDGDAAREGDADRLAEALEVARAVLEDDHPTVAGRIYHVDDAVNRPAPVQAGGVPLVVFVHGRGPGRHGLLEVCARAADAVVVGGGADGVRDARAVMDDADPARHRAGTQPLLLARVTAGTDVARELADVRAAGADGSLAELAAPWDGPAPVAADLVW
jgi:alkanesulfonate monooxygenase SsuD/methylene tetrahydromethanopterin reductase-like flavin-dependent oxidoreductase (luciferase family)